EIIALPTMWGTVHIENGKIVSARSGDFGQIYPLDSYQSLTVESLFDKVRSYAFNPFCTTTVHYKKNMGYPKTARFTCVSELIPGIDGERGFKVQKFKVSP